MEIPLDGSTAYHREASASAAEVSSGSEVLVRLEQSAPGEGGIGGGELPPASDVTVISP